MDSVYEYLLYFSLIVFTTLLYFRHGRKPKNYPPGPFQLPLIGNVLSIGNQVHVAFTRFANEYGPIFSIKFPGEDSIVLHGASHIKEAFNHPGITGRPCKEAAEVFLSGGRQGIVLAVGKNWSEQRKFAIRQLREFGFGKKSMESLILDEANELVEWIKKQNGQPIALKRRLGLAGINTLWTMLCGKRYSHDDPKIVGILNQLETTAEAILSMTLKSVVLFCFPNFAKFFPNWSGWNYLLETMAPRQRLFEETIQEHQRTLPDGHSRDFIDVYLQEVKKTEDTRSIFHKSTGESALRSLMAEFFLAGSDTTTSTMDWAILYLIHFQDVQQKLQNEIEFVTGNSSRLPSLADRSSMPYAEAFIMEVLRISSILSFGIPHCAEVDVELSSGYLIPKGTSVYSSLYATHHDPLVWGDPENFRPERFLSPDGSKVEKHESWIPFSTGRRQCPGETLARDQLFLILTTLVQTFRISSEPGKTLPTLDIVFGKVTLQPHPYLVVMKERA